MGWKRRKPSDLKVYIQCIVHYEDLGAIFLKCYVRLKEPGGEEDQILNLLNSRSTENKSYKLRNGRISLCDPMDRSPSGSSVHGIFQARILEWVARPFSTGSSWPRDQTWVSHIAGRFFTIWATQEAPG